MKSITEKVSYLQGLCEGLNVSDSGPNGKIIYGMLQAMEEMADMLEAMQQEINSLQEYVEDMDDEILELEEKIWGTESNDQDVVEVRCLQCGEQLYFETSILDDDDVLEITCPNCNTVVYVNDGSFDFETYSEDEDFSNQEIETKNHS
ncbi:hypothetical protein ASZ90_017517 [hydrocarbon metagenome]|uniref:AraC family transcriptional regulator n=1 Tax=hydrocarbon metagenome TaxID=938273 RepID=A0A0W8E8S4_9ZZZZ